MHKRLLNEATFSLTISAEGPLLVKSGIESWDPTRPDMEFMRAHHAKLGETVFLPGSSLKGTIRSYSEKIARTLNVECCDPFSKDDSCGTRKELKKLSEDNESAKIYEASCVACKLYGSTNLAGRAAFADAYPHEDLSKRLAKRTAVAIDRVLGSVAAGPFDFEALMSGDFHTEIRLRNFELWQIGLLGLAIRDFCFGRIKIGYGKSRGFGSVSARLDKLELRSIADEGLTANDGKLTIKGIGALLGDERKQYGIEETEGVSLTTTIKPIPDFIGASVIFERLADSEKPYSAEAETLFAECVKIHWTDYKKAHSAKGEDNG